MKLSDNMADYKDLDPFQMFREHFTQDEDTLRDLAHSKRFLERLCGDDVFMQSVLSGEMSLAEAAAACGCRIDVETLRPVFDPAFTQHRQTASEVNWRLTKLWNDHLERSARTRNTLLLKGSSNGLNARFDAWRARNINRAALQLGICSAGITHPPVCFELSAGCSVGCWFCGISAEAFRGHATLADGGAERWRATLESVKAVIGDGLRCGFGYWATDPLDNPEYMGFIDIFEDVAGVVPQTTTAIPLRDIALTRRVLDRWAERRTVPNRFSIITKRTLLQVHEEFTPEELLGVELVIQIASGGGTTKFRAGRTYGGGKGRDRVVKERSTDGTIACVSGFLVNIVEQTVKLISPTMPSEEHPLGYIVYAQDRYADPKDLRRILEGFVDVHMPDSLVGDRPIGITSGGSYDANRDRTKIRFREFALENEALAVLGDMLGTGEMDPISILTASAGAGARPLQTVAALDSLWKEGVLQQAAA